MYFHYSAQPTGTDIISLADMKEWLRVDHSDEDTTITAIIDSAVQSIQNYTGRHFKTTTFIATLDSFHSATFPYEVSAITAISYIDRAGSVQTLISTKYFLDLYTQPARIKFKNTPDVIEDEFNAITISGTITNSIKPPLVHAIKMLSAHFYENRRAVIVGTISSEIPLGIKALINPYRIISLK
jgi:uncharacterized phiE125 gp8 family phage protein